jgi:peptidoglycan/LPS O-acetylase OafA/YrhL
LLPTVEGACYAVGIAWYDSSFSFGDRGLSGFFARAGAYSYSIYLLHFFLVFRAAHFVHAHFLHSANFYLACLWSAAFFVVMVLIGSLSYRFIESPFLKYRQRYTVARAPSNALAPGATAAPSM